MVQFAISSKYKLVLVNGWFSVSTGVKGKLIAELSRFSVDKTFFLLMYQFLECLFRYVFAQFMLMLICLIYKVIIIIKAFHVVFCQKVELECILFQMIFIF